MKIIIQKPGEPEPAMILHLTNYGNEVWLMGTDAHGEEWEIAHISTSGISLHNGIKPSSGWPLDEHGRLELIDKFAKA